MISIETYRRRIGLFAGGRGYKGKREKNYNVDGTWADYAFVLLCVLGPWLVTNCFYCAVETNGYAFNKKPVSLAFVHNYRLSTSAGIANSTQQWGGVDDVSGRPRTVSALSLIHI